MVRGENSTLEQFAAEPASHYRLSRHLAGHGGTPPAPLIFWVDHRAPVLPPVHPHARVGPFRGRPPYRGATFVIQYLAAKERGWLAARQRFCRPDSSLRRPDGACPARVAGDRVLSDGFVGSSPGMGAGISDRGCFVRLFCGVYAIMAGSQGGAETSPESAALDRWSVCGDYALASPGAMIGDLEQKEAVGMKAAFLLTVMGG